MRMIEVSVTHPFGRIAIRPVNDTAMLFAKLLKQDSFTRKDIENIKALGYAVRVQAPKAEEL